NFEFWRKAAQDRTKEVHIFFKFGNSEASAVRTKLNIDARDNLRFSSTTPAIHEARSNRHIRADTGRHAEAEALLETRIQEVADRYPGFLPVRADVGGKFSVFSMNDFNGWSFFGWSKVATTH